MALSAPSLILLSFCLHTLELISGFVIIVVAACFFYFDIILDQQGSCKHSIQRVLCSFHPDSYNNNIFYNHSEIIKIRKLMLDSTNNWTGVCVQNLPLLTSILFFFWVSISLKLFSHVYFPTVGKWTVSSLQRNCLMLPHSSHSLPSTLKLENYHRV